MKSKSERDNEIADLCEQAGCSAPIREIHRLQFSRRWHPHPSLAFTSWWSTHADSGKGEGVGVRRAWNCDIYRKEFLDRRKLNDLA